MRSYTRTHRHYCGNDLHAKTLYLSILDREGTIVVHENRRSRPEAFHRLRSVPGIGKILALTILYEPVGSPPGSAGEASRVQQFRKTRKLPPVSRSKLCERELHVELQDATAQRMGV